MRQVKLIFIEVLKDRNMSEEMTFLLNMLMDSYPFSGNQSWKIKLLRKYPAMWDGKSRANFIVDFYYNWTSDSQKFKKLNKALLSVNYLIKLPGFQSGGWIKMIPSPSSFYEVLTFSNPQTELFPYVNPPAPQYLENEIRDTLRYSRAVLDHHIQTKGYGRPMEINYIELCISNLFQYFIVGLYMEQLNSFVTVLGAALLAAE
ncbi:hypothetical protein POM88_038783 [Heracleum sosnowskyi]|uniref:Uncharacterized protein n=1 Tax=Heracleum sosnowskyi TaxID=360622 RepID=A0AAD8HBQ2_9APIA|nr:hypothetical protein POM88_038783 [Heracleum sosnowskyi]